jgi:hypothetical protein
MSRVASAPWQPNSRKLGFRFQCSGVSNRKHGGWHPTSETDALDYPMTSRQSLETISSKLTG